MGPSRPPRSPVGLGENCGCCALRQKSCRSEEADGMTVCHGVKFIRLHTYKYVIGKTYRGPVLSRNGVKVEPSLRRCEGMKRTLKGCFMHFIPSWRREAVGPSWGTSPAFRRAP